MTSHISNAGFCVFLFLFVFLNFSSHVAFAFRAERGCANRSGDLAPAAAKFGSAVSHLMGRNSAVYKQHTAGLVAVPGASFLVKQCKSVAFFLFCFVFLLLIASAKKAVAAVVLKSSI